MKPEGLSTSSNDQKIITTVLPNDSLSCKAVKKVSMKTDKIENKSLQVKETHPYYSAPKSGQTSQPAYDHQLNNINNCANSQVKLVDIL